jgi:membrane protease subunit (stomatin/prohibitin family)
MALITMQDGAITGMIAEPGGFEFKSDDPNSQSIFSGGGLLSATIGQSWERFKFGGSPATQQTAFYVNLKEIPNNKFGTQSEIYWDDAYLNIQAGAMTRGTYTLKIVDPILFIKNFVPVSFVQGDSGVFDFADMDNPASEQLFTEVVSSLAAAFSMYTNDPSRNNRITKLQSDQIGFAKTLSQAVEDAYAWRSDRGLEIAKVAIAAIEYDANTKAVLIDVQKADALSGSRGDSFFKQSAARGLEGAGENGGGAAGMTLMGMGINAAGNAMGQFGVGSEQYSNPNLSFNQQQNTKPAEEKKEEDKEEDPYERLAKLKKLLDQGVISQEEFDAAKAKLLGV